MSLYRGDKRVTLATNTPSNVVPLEVKRDGVYTVPAGVNGFNPVNINVNHQYANYGLHTDTNGIWHKPEEWDDIESIDLGDRQELYFLCACHLTGLDFFRVRVSGTGLSWSYGHVSNGVYTLHQDSTETTINNLDYISLFLSDIQDDYIVIRIKATTSLSWCQYQAWVADAHINYAMPFRCQSVLMRYGRMPKGANLQNSATYFLESDNIIDFAKDHWNTTQAITISNAYESAHCLQRWRYTGWDLAKNKVTSFYGMFIYCYSLSDVPNPLNLDGWCTSNTTSIRNFFNECRSLSGTIKVNYWDVSNVTEMSTIFSNCFSLKKIEGLETWNAAPKCNRIESMFNSCYSLQGTIDISKLYLGNGTASIANMGGIFAGCSSISKINISNTNFSKATQINSLFNATRSCKEIVMNNITPISSLCTNTSYFCQATGVHELIIDGWDFSGNSGVNFLTYCNASIGLKKIVFRNCIAPSTSIADTSVACIYFIDSRSLEYLDVSFIDMSIFTGTQTHNNSFKNLTRLVDFYPPQNISKNFSLATNYSLSHDSLIRVINNLKTVSTTQTLTIGAYNIAKLSAAEQAVATGKGWTLA